MARRCRSKKLNPKRARKVSGKAVDEEVAAEVVVAVAAALEEAEVAVDAEAAAAAGEEDSPLTNPVTGRAQTATTPTSLAELSATDARRPSPAVAAEVAAVDMAVAVLLSTARNTLGNSSHHTGVDMVEGATTDKQPAGVAATEGSKLAGMAAAPEGTVPVAAAAPTTRLPPVAVGTARRLLVVATVPADMEVANRAMVVVSDIRWIARCIAKTL